ncbi:MAG: hypothetical protein ACYDB2_01355 [Acidimicrobiales bacterium]
MATPQRPAGACSETARTRRLDQHASSLLADRKRRRCASPWNVRDDDVQREQSSRLATSAAVSMKAGSLNSIDIAQGAFLWYLPIYRAR